MDFEKIIWREIYLDIQVRHSEIKNFKTKNETARRNPDSFYARGRKKSPNQIRANRRSDYAPCKWLGVVLMNWLAQHFIELLIFIGLIFGLAILILGSALASGKHVWAQCRDCGEWFNEIGEQQPDAPIICSHPLKGICSTCREKQFRQLEK